MECTRYTFVYVGPKEMKSTIGTAALVSNTVKSTVRRMTGKDASEASAECVGSMGIPELKRRATIAALLLMSFSQQSSRLRDSQMISYGKLRRLECPNIHAPMIILSVWRRKKPQAQVKEARVDS